jgi:hypothetical protein
MPVLAIPNTRYPPSPDDLGNATLVVDSVSDVTADVVRHMGSAASETVS